MFWPGKTPWPRKASWLPVSVPPTLIRFVVTPGTWETMAHGSRAFGTFSITSSVKLNATSVAAVSITGASPVTVTVSSRAATLSSAFSVKVVSVEIRTPS